MAQVQPVPWYGDDPEKIPYCFVIRGQAWKFPDNALNSDGVPLIAPVFVLPPVDAPKDFKPMHALKLDLEHYVCLICRIKQKGNRQASNNSNAFNHIRSSHIEEYPINCWTKDEAYNRQRKWEKDLTEAKRTKSQSNQLTLQQTFGHRILGVPEQIQAWTEAVVIGNLVLSIERNKGTRKLISFYNGGNRPRGLSYRGIIRNIDSEYDKIIDVSKNMLRVALMDAIPELEKENDPDMLRRRYSLAHDIFTNDEGYSFTTMCVTHINNDCRPWKLVRVQFLWPHDSDHTSENNLANCVEVLASVGLTVRSILMSCQDTTGNSINTFDSVDHLGQLLCCSHTDELVSKHAVEDCEDLSRALDNIRKLLARARGNKSSKRRRLLISKCEEAGINAMKIVLPVAVRWGTNVAATNCFIDLVPAFDLYTDEDVPSSTNEQANFTDLLEAAKEDIDLVQACLPMLTVILEWTQVLTSAHTPSIGLVLLAVNRMKASLEHMMTLSSLTGVEVRLRGQIRTAHDSFRHWLDHYYNERFLDFWLFKVTAFLDPRGFCALPTEKWKQTVESIKLRCTEEERMSPFELHERETSQGRTEQGARRNVRPRTAAPTLTAEEEFMQSIRGDTEQYSKVVPLIDEVQRYIPFVKEEIRKGRDEGYIIDPLDFWAAHESLFPILAREAAAVFSAEPSAGDPERIGSKATLLYTPLRNSLSPERAKTIVFLNSFYSDRDSFSKRKADAAAKRIEVFIKFQSFGCQDNRNVLSEDAITHLNSLCAWVHYQDDSSDEEDLDEDEA